MINIHVVNEISRCLSKCLIIFVCIENRFSASLIFVVDRRQSTIRRGLFRYFGGSRKWPTLFFLLLLLMFVSAELAFSTVYHRGDTSDCHFFGWKWSTVN